MLCLPVPSALEEIASRQAWDQPGVCYAEPGLRVQCLYDPLGADGVIE